MSLTVNHILETVSSVLFEPVVATTLGTSIAAGARTVTPGSMSWIYVGAKLIIGGATEIVVVTATSATTFDAVFASAHLAADTVKGATFPKGQPTHALFSIDEMLGYFADVQNAFLVAVRPVYDTSVVAFAMASGRVYDQPDLALRIERIAIAGQTLKNVSSVELDLQDPTWRSQTEPNTPTAWHQDEVNTGRFGFKPAPQVGGNADVWHSVRGPSSVVLTDTLVVPEIFAHILKYGILARCYSKDGEQRDPQRADYADKRFQFGIMLADKFMEGINAKLGQSAARTYRPLVMQPPG